MKKFSFDEEEDNNVDMTPLIDMVFILLIFFIVTTVFVKEAGVEIQRPQASSAETLEKQSLFIAITANGRIMAEGQEFTLNSLRSFVDFRLQQKQIPVVIQADKDSRSSRLIDVLDECKLAGAESIHVAAETE
mgnify:CR=1 FL=1